MRDVNRARQLEIGLIIIFIMASILQRFLQQARLNENP